MIRNIFSKMPALTAILAAAIVFIPGMAIASYGPDRPTIEYQGPGTAGADYVVFNSFTGVPNIGDERQFLNGQVVGTGVYSDPVNAEIGDEVLVRVYVHNNAASSRNDSGESVAINTRVRVDLPTTVGTDLQANAFISADNAQPQEIFDSINITSSDAFRLDYIEGSANIRTNFIDQPLSDDLVNGGVQIGHDNLNGVMNGCFEYAAFVTFRVQLVEDPQLNVNKEVRFEGQTSEDWTKSLSGVEVGDIVEYKITVENTGDSNIDDLIVGDNLPPYLSYVEGSDLVINQLNFPNGNQLGDQVTTGGVILKDTYSPGSFAIVLLKARVNEITDNCGVLTLTNVGLARTAATENVEATADIIVDSGKSCSTTTADPIPTTPATLPNTGAGSMIAALLGTGSATAALRSWLQSRKAVKASLLQ